jgi:hypothetical protein
VTRQDYVRMAEKLSKGLGECASQQERYGYSLAVAALGDALKADNVRFSQDRFEDAIFGKREAVKVVA